MRQQVIIMARLRSGNKFSRQGKAGGSNRQAARGDGAAEAAEHATATREQPGSRPAPRSDIGEHTSSGQSLDRQVARRDSDRDQLGLLPQMGASSLDERVAESLRNMLAAGDGQVGTCSECLENVITVMRSMVHVDGGRHNRVWHGHTRGNLAYAWCLRSWRRGSDA